MKFSVAGAQGAGKSTTLEIIEPCGEKTSGEVLWTVYTWNKVNLRLEIKKIIVSSDGIIQL